MVVTVENAFGVTVGILIAGELPDNDSLVWIIFERLDQI